MMELAKLILLPVRTLGLSAAFCGHCEMLGYQTIGEIIADKKQLLASSQVDYHWLEELCQWLSKHQGLHLLQALPGSTGGSAG